MVARFADISGAPSQARNAGESGTAWRVEQGAAVKYWEIIADNLSKRGWSWGCVATADSNGRTFFIADAHRDDGKRFVVHAEEKLTAFLELEAAIRDCGKLA